MRRFAIAVLAVATLMLMAACEGVAGFGASSPSPSGAMMEHSPSPSGAMMEHSPSPSGAMMEHSPTPSK
jgi:hypothetical protein